MGCKHRYLWLSDRRSDAREVKREAERRGWVGGVAYALRLMSSPRLTPDGAPINLLVAQDVLANLLDGHADWYANMADSEMQHRAEREAAAERRGGDGTEE